MLAVVFNQEMLLADRRQRAHRLRWLYAGFVIVQVLPLFFRADSFNAWLSGNGFSDFFERFIILHFGLVALLTPAMVASAITEEKTSGTLQYLLTAYLSPWEIVLGKLLARISQLVLMSLAWLPLICLFSGFGGVGELPVALLILSLALIFGMAAVSILASVWCRLTRDAMLTVYLLGLVLFATLALTSSPRLLALGDRLMPLRALTLDHGRLNWQRVGACVLTWSVLGLFCLAVASLRLRGAYLRQLRAVPRSTSRWLPAWRPRMRANPVLWREQHVVGLAPLPWLRRWPRWLACVIVVALTVFSLAWRLDSSFRAPSPVGGVKMFQIEREPLMSSALQCFMSRSWKHPSDLLENTARNNNILYWHGLAALLAASFVIAVRASGCITDERQRETWQPLLQTPLTTRAILRGKQLGILGACVPYFIAYSAPVLVVSVLVSAWATAWSLLWLIATVFAGLFVVAVGIWCSARMHNSWLSLLATVGLCYGSWIALTGPVAIGAWFLQGILGIIAEFFDWLFGLGPVVGAVQSFNPLWLVFGLSFVAAFWFLTDRLLVAAEKQIGRRDRARDVDPQHAEFHERWLRHITQTAGVVAPTDEALLTPLHVTPEPADDPVPVPDIEMADDPDVLLPVPPALNPLQDYNQHA